MRDRSTGRPISLESHSITTSAPHATNEALRLVNARSLRGSVDPFLDALDESARNVTGDVDPLLANPERPSEATPLSVGAASRPLRAEEKVERGQNASPVVLHPAIVA